MSPGTGADGLCPAGARQVSMMDDYPEYKFVISQSVQLEWVKVDYPTLYARILDKARTGQMVPVGGTFVEPDMNIPSGLCGYAGDRNVSDGPILYALGSPCLYFATRGTLSILLFLLAFVLLIF